MLGILGILLGTTIIQPLDYDFNYSPVVESTTEQIEHVGYSSDDYRQAIVQRAYDLGGMDFVVMIECENGNRDINAVSSTHDYGLCQLNYKYNKEFIKSDEFHDWNKQLEYCYNKWVVNPKLWYGPSRIIKGKKCKDYVLDRFLVK